MAKELNKPRVTKKKNNNKNDYPRIHEKEQQKETPIEA